MPSSIVPLVVAVGGTALWELLFQRFARFTYGVDESGIHLRWYVARYIRVSRCDIGLGEVRGVTPVPPLRGLVGGFHIFGNLLAGKGVLIMLKRRMLRYSFARSIYFTPDEPEIFMAEVTKRLAASGGLSPSAPTNTGNPL